WPRVKAGGRDDPDSMLPAYYCIAPYQFVLVSISPTVIIMTPAEFGKFDLEAAARLKQVEDYRSHGARRHLVNAITGGVEVPFAPGMKWGSDELNQPLTDLSFDAQQEAVISLPDGQLRLKRLGDKCEVVRE
ncbi:MAG: hypothetical protein ACRC7O_16815, partial [Fimbriiglobus sp.]